MVKISNNSQIENDNHLLYTIFLPLSFILNLDFNLMKKLLFFIAFIITQNNLFSQKYDGQVLDFDTNVPIAFVKINYNETVFYTNWEGKFTFEYNNDKKPLLLSYKGYTNKSYYLPEKKQFLLLKMVSDNSLKEQEIYSENKVNFIIKKVIEQKKHNQPEKALANFEYKNYEHAIFSANPDSISEKIDTIYKRNIFGNKKVKLDSSNFKFKKLVQKQHIYQTEKINLIQHNKKGSKETIIASRMAGFKKPIYEYLGLNLVPYSLYENKLDILEVPVKNPISQNGRKSFTYKLIDSTQIENRKVYCIYFQPKNFKSNNLRGLLFVDAQNYGIAKAFYRIYGVANINATYTFNYLKEYQIWFPEKRKFIIVKGENSEDITILGGTIKFSSTVNDRIKNDASDNVFLKIESTPFDIKINKESDFKNRYIAIDVPDAGLSKPESYWKTFTKDSIDVRRISTYTSLDSLSQAEKIESKLLFGRKIINGYLPLNLFDLDLRSVVKFNNYEGFRFGFGGVTNDKLSTQYRLGAYVGYGLKDNKFKYGITPSFALHKESNTWVSISYIDDLSEIGQIQFYTQNRRFKIYDPRPFNVPTFYNHKTYAGFIESKFIPKTEGYFGISRTQIAPLFDYSFYHNDTYYTRFNLTTAVLSLQWNPFSDYMQTSSGRIEINKRFPKINFQATQSFENMFESDFNFTKIEAKITYDIPYLSGQITSIMAQGGIGFGAIPITHLYSIAPNNLNRDTLLKRITFAGKNSFETMFYNEFFSSSYASLQLRHTFDRIKIAYRIKPVLSIVTRMAVGTTENQENHFGRDFKTLENGYFESGIELNKIYKGFGLSGFYRYGYYAMPRFEDNLAIKISFNLDLGF
jgi:hypothetical protein